MILYTEFFIYTKNQLVKIKFLIKQGILCFPINDSKYKFIF